MTSKDQRILFDSAMTSKDQEEVLFDSESGTIITSKKEIQCLDVVNYLKPIVIESGERHKKTLILFLHGVHGGEKGKITPADGKELTGFKVFPRRIKVKVDKCTNPVESMPIDLGGYLEEGRIKERNIHD